MKRLIYLFILTLALVSCGTSSDHFKIEGRFLHLNQGEFYVYSTDGVIAGVDTVKINGGRFAYEIPCKENGTLVLIFPNFSEQPVFAEPGKAVSVNADASHLKEMEVKGTASNELMTEFRKATATSAPPDVLKTAEMFINDNPASPVSVYLLRRYFVQGDKPDYDKAYSMTEALLKRQERNGVLVRMQQDIKAMKASAVGSKVPAFSVKDINGDIVSNANIRGSVAVISTMASWSYESLSVQRQIRDLMKRNAGKLVAITISLDAARHECLNALKRDSVTWTTVCDELMFESPAVKQLGLGSVPDNIIVSAEGRVAAHGLNAKDLKEKLEKMLSGK